ncbi:MAG: phenylalanine--tRNA ligase subunit beta, partial [Chloroflexi bacterium]|nr:phenylalanine--tRNA ligase subunit beta [Chloroflexota bacterium]
FDRAGLRSSGVVARRAREGEQLTTLDGRSHALTTDDLVIADGSGPVGLAGVMGGSSTEVSDSTTEVVLESASFSGVSVRKTVQRHRIEVGGKRGTAASHRFERGLPIELAPEALRRATKLLVEICNGTAAQGIVDVYPAPSPRPVVTLTSQRLRRVLGVDLGVETVARALRSLGFAVTGSGPGEPEGLDVTTPFWRSDIAIPEDLIEEVARVIGYDAIPTTLPAATLMDQQSDPRRDLKEAARDALVGLGLQETISYPLVSAESLALTAPEGTAAPLTIVNRMSPDQEALRTTLRGSLLRTYAQNERSNRVDSLRLFEIGRTYTRRADDLPIEHEIAAAVVGGQRSERTWHGDESGVMDFFDAKGLVEALLERLGISADFTPAEDRALAPGRTARITAGEAKDPIGFIGEVHPDILVAMDIREPRVMLFEVDLDVALRHRSQRLRTWRAVSRYPGLVRELAFVVDASASAGPIDRILRGFPAVAESSLVDVYVGSQIPDGKKSLAFRIVWQSPTRTLTDAEVEIAQAQLLEKLEREAGAVLRS